MPTLLKRNQPDEIYAEVVTVTPETATSWLLLNKENRPLSTKTVKVYSDYMENGEWVLNGESIKFSLDNVLIDGQHRLLAVIKAGIPVRMMVMHNIIPEAFQTLDTGKGRSGADVLATANFTYSSRLSTAICCFIKLHRKQLLQTSRHAAGSISNTQILEFAKSNPEIIEDMYEVIGKSKLFNVVPPSVAVGLYPLIKSADKDKAEAFINILANGYDDGYPGNNAAIALRNKLTSVRFADKRPRQGDYANFFIVSWNSFYRDIVTTIAKKSGKLDTLKIMGAGNIWNESK